jgi:ATP-binding protein involved in chromosome partitioning
MNYTFDQVMDALSRVNHPASGLDIVSMNMISDVVIEGSKVQFAITFPRANDPLISSIKKACARAVETRLPGTEVEQHLIIRSIEPSVPEMGIAAVKNIIAVSSGKGGVGKSTVATNLAVAIASMGYKTGLIDADVYGPSIPKMFGVEDAHPKVVNASGKEVIQPIEKYGVQVLSIGFFVKPEDAMVWRGPMATSALKQLIGQGNWGALDFLLIDLPPGTGDIHLTMVQEIGVTGAVIVSTPQEVALADVIKGINMFRGEKINVPVLGLIENMAWFTPAELPGKKYYIFGKEGCKKLAEKLGVPLLGQIPIVQSVSENSDKGTPVALDPTSPEGGAFHILAQNMIDAVEKRNKEQDPTKKVEMTDTRGCAPEKEK